MNLLLSKRVRIFFAITVFAIKALAAGTGLTVYDSLVETLFQANQFREVSNLVSKKLKGGKLPNVNLELYYYNSLSMAMLRLNDLDSAKICAYRSIQLASGSTDSNLVSNAWKVMSYAYNKSGQLDSALFFTSKLMNYSKRAGDDRQQRNALVSMGTILMQNKRAVEALKFYRESGVLTFKIKDSVNFPSYFFNMGLTWLALKRYDSCLFYMRKSVVLAEQRNLSDVLVYAYGTMADCYLAMGNMAERKKYLLMANEKALRIGNLQFLAMGYSNLLEGAVNDKHYGEAAGYGAKADSLLKKEPYPVLQMKVDSMMYVSYAGLSKPAEALIWYQAFVKIRDQVRNDRQAGLLDKMMVEYGMKEKDLTIENQNLEIRSKKRQLQFMVMLLFIIGLFIAGLVYYIIRMRTYKETLYRKEKQLDGEIANMLQYKFSTLKKNIERKPEINEEKEDIHSAAATEDVLIPHYALYMKLQELLRLQKLYLNPDLNLKLMINLLGTNKKYLYQAIAGHGEENFRQMINRFRVDEARRIIEENIEKNMPLDNETIFPASGFNSAVSFYRAFKFHTGLTPQEYASETRKELKKNKKLSATSD